MGGYPGAARSLGLAAVLTLIPSLAPAQSTDISKLRQKIDTLLRDELTKHWYPAALDGENGGFHQDYARDWSPRRDENRFLVYQSRMTWTAAAFARYAPDRRDEYVKYAKYGVAYLDTVMRDKEQGGFHWTLDVHGKLDPKVGGEKHVYGTAFALYAASVAYEVTHDPTALKVARDAFDWLESHAHDAEHGGYFEALTRDGKPILRHEDDATLAQRADRLGVYYGFKSMNSHIHLLEALAEFHRVEKTPKARERLAETLAVVRDKVAIAPGALNLYLTRDWRAVPAHDSFGHDVETAYLLVEAAEALGIGDDRPTWQMARSLIDHALDHGWDERYGGFYDKGDVFAGHPYDMNKIWWTQAEGLNTLLVMHKKYGGEADRYGKAFLKQWSFIEAHQLDPEFGGWFGETTREGKLLGDGRKASQWKANYHTSRALMNVATMLREIESSGGHLP